MWDTTVQLGCSTKNSNSEKHKKRLVGVRFGGGVFQNKRYHIISLLQPNRPDLVGRKQL